MKYKKVIAYVLALLVVVGTTPIRVGAAAYTVSGNTATAIEGTTSWTPSGGVGTATVDLKSGNLEFEGVSITPNSLGSKYSRASSESTVTHTGWVIPASVSWTVDLWTGTTKYYSSFRGTRERPYLLFYPGYGHRSSTSTTGIVETVDTIYTDVNRIRETTTTYHYNNNPYPDLVSGSDALKFNGRVPVYHYNDTPTAVVSWATGTKTWTASPDLDFREIGNKSGLNVKLSSGNLKLYVHSFKHNFGGKITYGGDMYFPALSLRLPGYVYSSQDKHVAVIQPNEYIHSFTSCTIPDEVQKTFYVPQVSNVVGAKQINDITLKNCSSNNQTFDSAYHPLLPVGVSGTKVTIDGGYYIGSPAVSNGYNVTVKKGTFVDTGNTLSSFMVDPDSEVSSITQGDGIKTTVVKESNPPINIDWGEFPMPDMTAPIISVTRNPASTTEPTDSVTLTINVDDPNGNNHEKPISINGGAWQANGAKYTVTENQTVSIVARDSEGNIREYNVNITNIDEKAPEVTGWTQSTDAWTSDPVRVYVEAVDDVKLADAPYKFTFTPDQPGSTSTATGSWQSNRFVEVTGNGTVNVTVMDATGKQSTDSYYVRNIDLTAPTATYTISPPEDIKASPSTGVTIELHPQNTGDPITQDGADMASNWIKWSDTEAWTDNAVKTVYENGIYHVKVRDAVGNVGNVDITISNVSTDKPVITSFTSTAMDKVAAIAPVTLTVAAHGSGDTPLADKPYSWDGGKTWTSLNTHEVSDNGEYTIIVRDEAGTTAEASMIITNIDAIAPTAGVYLYKGLPSDFEGTDPTPDDYVWKIRVEASDIGSGIDRIETLWDSGVHTSTTVTQDVWEPGVYGAMIYDVAGNRTYAEKIVTAEAIGDAGSSDEYVPIEVPSTGSAGSHFNASINDLVYGPTGAYNKSTGEFKTYLSGQEGILVDLLIDAKRTTTVSGYATFNGMKYPVYFDGAETAAGTSNMSAQVLIPIADIPEDINNGRLVVVVQEHDKRDTDTIEREGFATFYASVQITSPKITYQYSRDTNELMMQAISTVAGIKSNTYDIGPGEVSYTVPFDVGTATTITLKAVDNVGNATTEVLDADSLDLNGGAGGSLPTEDSSGSELNTYYISGRSAEVYIMGGTRNNTTNVPSSEVLEMILGTP